MWRYVRGVIFLGLEKRKAALITGQPLCFFVYCRISRAKLVLPLASDSRRRYSPGLNAPAERFFSPSMA